MSDQDRLVVGSAGTLETEAALTAQSITFKTPTVPIRQPAMAKPEWLFDIVELLVQLIQMPPNWDSYSANQVSPRAAETLLRLLIERAAPFTPKPFVYATPDGGVGCEWQTTHRRLQIEVDPEMGGSLFYMDNLTERQWEGTLGEEPDGLDKLIWLVSAES